MLSPLLSTKEVAKLTGLSVGWLEQLRSRGQGPAVTRFGRRVAFTQEAVEAWIKKHQVKTAA